MITAFEGVYIGLVFALGSAVQALTGFGFAIVSALLLAFVFEVRTATLSILLVVMVLLSSVFIQNVQKTGLHIKWRSVAFPAVGTVAGRFLGVYLLERLSASTLVFLMASTLLVIAVYFLFVEKRIRVPDGVVGGLSTGLLSGVFGGLFNFSGPPLVAYFRTATDSPAQFVTTMQVALAVGAFVSLGTHLWLGNFDARTLSLAGFGAGGCVIGSIIGHQLFLRVPRELFSRIVSYTIVVMTCALFVYRLVSSNPG